VEFSATTAVFETSAPAKQVEAKKERKVVERVKNQIRVRGKSLKAGALVWRRRRALCKKNPAANAAGMAKISCSADKDKRRQADAHCTQQISRRIQPPRINLISAALAQNIQAPRALKWSKNIK
jgi:hypothetical protein